MKSRFKETESYKHKAAKEIVKEWIWNNPKLVFCKEVFKIKIEEKFCSLGNIDFVPDLTVYAENGAQVFLEIFHKHQLTPEKIEKIEKYCKLHKWDNCLICEVDADYVLNQIKQPEYIKFNLIYQL